MDSFPVLHKYPYICIDLETTGLDWYSDSVFGVALSTPDGNSYYWDVRKTPKVIPYLRKELPKAKRVVNHNLKFDNHFLKSLDIELPKDLYCTQIGASILYSEEPQFSLDALSKKYLTVHKQVDIYQDLSEIFGGLPTKRVQVKNFSKAPFELMARYAKMDTITALKLYEYQAGAMCQELKKVMEFEMKLFPCVLDMERRGVRIDVELAHRKVDVLDSKVSKLQSELNSVSGFEVNTNSSKQISKILEPEFCLDTGFWHLKDGTRLNETPTGQPSFGSEQLECSQMKEAILISKIKRYVNAKDTFLKGQLLGNLRGDYIYPNINQTKGEIGGAGTGRLSYNSPNLQNIPARNPEIAKMLRPIFLPDPGQEWACSDYSQFEFRMFAHYINDADINQKYLENPATDFHQMVADLANIPRPKAKTVNLGLTFGMGEGRLAEELKMPFERKSVTFNNGQVKIINVAGPEAKELMERYHESMPGVRVLLKRVPAIAKSRGYIKSIIGRRKMYTDGKGIYKSPAHLYQGSSADCMKQKLIELYPYLKANGGRIMLSVHDEFNCSLPRDTVKKNMKDIKEILECYDGEKCPIKINVPILTDSGVGANWAEASGKGV